MNRAPNLSQLRQLQFPSPDLIFDLLLSVLQLPCRSIRILQLKLCLPRLWPGDPVTGGKPWWQGPPLTSCPPNPLQQSGARWEPVQSPSFLGLFGLIVFLYRNTMFKLRLTRNSGGLGLCLQFWGLAFLLRAICNYINMTSRQASMSQMTPQIMLSCSFTCFSCLLRFRSCCCKASWDGNASHLNPNKFVSTPINPDSSLRVFPPK